jgi:site-specific recombinase XerD
MANAWRPANTLGFSLVSSIGLDSKLFGTHSLRRTKATLIYRRTGNLRAVQLLLGHTKIESTVRYLGIKVDDALSIAEQVEIWDARAERTSSARSISAGLGPKPRFPPETVTIL